MTDQKYAYVGNSPVAGNGLFAEKEILAGDLILSVSQPLVGTLDIARLADTCANCFTWTAGPSIVTGTYVAEGVSVNKCSGCQQLRYCSKKCQRQSWKRYHKDECDIIGNMDGKQLPKAVRATIQILSMRAKGLINDVVWSSFLRLESHINEMRASGDQWADIQIMAQGAYNFSGTQHAFTLEFATEVFAKVLTNCMTLVTPTLDPLGICLDPIAAYANHSCDPNAFVIMDGPELSFRSLKRIKKDEEILISYVDVTNPYARRQYELKHRWFFNCRCSKCRKGPTLREDLFNFTPDKLDQRWRDAADHLLKVTNFADDPSNWVGAEPEARRVAALQGAAFNEYEEAQALSDPNASVKKLEHGMLQCYQSKLWPIHRQPYAAMRHNLLVNMVSAGNYPLAFVQGATTYFLIDPVLYPQTHHPVRVVHNWTLAMLTLYIAGEQENPTVKQMLEMGINFGVVAYGLLYEVASNVDKSHSRSSSFAKAVHRKMEEVTVDLTRNNPSALRGMMDKIKKEWPIFEQISKWPEF